MSGFAIRRRSVLAGAGAVAAATALPLGCAAFSSAAPRSRKILGAPGTPAILQIVAHQDDDLLFMSPDLDTALNRGIPTTTVFLTAGEAAAGAVDGSQDAMTFAGERNAGSRIAYAQIMRSADDWTRDVVSLPGGQAYELATLKAAPHVRLLFLNLPDGADNVRVTSVPGAPDALALSGLLLGLRKEIPTVVPRNGPVSQAYSYNRAQVLDAVVGFIREFQPTILRTLDPNTREEHWRGPLDIGNDNPDHIAVARFVDLALAKHLSGGAAPTRIALTNYVGYGMSGLPANLTTTQTTAKTAMFSAYKAHDVNAQHYANSYPVYYGRRHYRWEPGSLLLAADGTGGGMSAFAVVNRQVVQWTCTDPAGAWEGPVSIGAPGSVQVSSVTQLDGRIRLFSLTVDSETGVSTIRTCVQAVPGEAFGTWSDAGNPWASRYNPESARQLAGDALGPPSAVATPDGTVHLFVVGPDGMWYRRALTASGWGPWKGKVGRYLLGDLAPVVDRQGLVHLFAQEMQEPIDQTAPAVPRLVHWHEITGFPELALDQGFPPVQTAGHPVVRLDSDGALRVFYQLPDTADTAMVTQQPDGTWNSFLRLAGTGGSGAPVVAAAPPAAAGLLHVAVRTTDSGVAMLRQGPDLAFGADWQNLGGFSHAAPALASDAAGRFVAALLSVEGVLQVSAQPAPGADVPYPPFRPVGK